MERLRRFCDLHALLLITLLAAEIGVFCWIVLNQVEPFFPPGFDQVSYYLDTYDLIERARAEGWWVLIKEYTEPRHGNGIFAVQGAVVGLLFGSRRTVILSVNLMYFIALQVVMFFTMRGRTRRVELSWLALAILISCASIFLRVGGIHDYRIDFAAFCLYGMWTCMIMWSRTFEDTRRAVAVSALTVLLVWLRFFTAMYVALILGILFVFFLMAGLRTTAEHRRASHLRRARNVFISGALAALAALPVLFLARRSIFDYYVVGHILTDEKYIRARELGLNEVIDHILYYPYSIGQHLGGGAGAVIAVIGIIAIASAFCFRRLPRTYFIRLRRYRFDLLALVLSVFVPIVVLTANISKSPVVGGIVLGPLILAIVLLIEPVWPRHVLVSQIILEASQWPALRRLASAAAPVALVKRLHWSTVIAAAQRVRIGGIITAIVVLVAVTTFLRGGNARQQYMSNEDLARVTQINEEIGRYALENRLPNPTVSFDRVAEYLNWGTLRLFTYERFGRLVDFDPLFGHGDYGIFATPRDVAMRLIMRSDIIILTDPVKGREAPYPMNTKIREYWDEMAAWTERNRVPLVSTQILNGPVRAFVVPPK